MLRTYEDFLEYLEQAGFLPLSTNVVDMPNVSELTEDWQWHTGLAETDPWEWKKRAVEEGRAAFAKAFGGRPSFIGPEWYPYFLAVRRSGASFDDAYEQGAASREAARIMALFSGDRKRLAAHEIRRMAGFDKSSSSRFEAAMIELQMGMFLTNCGQTRKTTLDGRPHGWPVLEYMPVEYWAWPGTWEKSLTLRREEAAEALLAQLGRLRSGLPRGRAMRFLVI